ncbi:MAG TPA: lamin tail domain-containing protein, partial [Flavobacteriales bacterium]|nr:lamin tail domain-containing protein [Flavobacteriales bacterium]
MKKILLAAFSLGSFFAGAQDPAPCTELFISEYIEGTSNNKALELYNPTSNPINLSAYSIKIYFNGSSTAGATFVPAGTLAAGQTFTIAHASATIFTGPDTTLGGVSVVSFNGNDALELLNGTTVIDVIGIVGVDPITNWAVGSGATNEFTLVRKSTVHNGYTNWTGSADTTYDVYPQNTVLYFGSHTIDPCPALAVTADFDFTGLCLSDTVYFTNTSYGGTGPYTFAWDFADGNISTQENPSHVFPTAGCYDVQLIVTDGLGDDDTIIQTVCVLATGDPMVTTADSVLCNDSFGMFLDADDTTGTWTGTYVSDSGNGDGFFSSAAIPPGTYYAIYTTGGSCPGTDTVVITVPTTPTAGFTYMVTGST